MATLSSTAAKRKGESLLTGGSAPKTSKSAPRSKAGGAKQSKAKPPKSANASMATLSSTAAKRKGGSAPKTSKSAPRSKPGGAKQSKAKPQNSANASVATLSSTGAKRKGGSAPKTSKSAPRSKAGGAKQSKASPSKSANGSMATLSSTVAKRKGESLLTGGSAPKKSKPAPESKAGDAKQSKAKPRKSAASMKDIPVKDDDLEGLSLKLNGTDWEALARRLKFQDPEITAFDKENEGLLPEKNQHLNKIRHQRSARSSAHIRS